MAEDTKPTEHKIPCPICGEMIKPGAKKCTHCGEFIEASAYIPCPVCGEPVQPVAKKCTHCNEWLEKDTRKLLGIPILTGFRGKKAWDWLSLLIVPLFLLIIVFLFNRAETSRQYAIEDRRATAQAQEVALQVYIDEMESLLREDRLSHSVPTDQAWILAQARTVRTLSALDETRRNILLGFLRTAGLIADPYLFGVEERSSVSEPGGVVSDLDAGQLSDALREQFAKHGVILTPEAPVIVEQDGGRWRIDSGSSAYSIRKEAGTLQVYRAAVQILRGADLSRVDLSGADLSEAGLHDANLSGANLHGAYLFRANLYIALLYGANLSESFLIDANLSGANLTGAKLLGADLTGANLTAAFLREADLREADLHRAELVWADLRGADLRDADLRWADLRQAKTDANTRFDDKWRLVWEIVNQGAQGRDLSGVDLSGADLSGANLRDASLLYTDLRGADLKDANLSGASLSGADLRDASLLDADLSGADLSGADLREPDLRGVDLSWADPSWADLREADLRGADLTGANLYDANLREADLSWGDLREADLRGADLRAADLRAADLRGADLSWADLSVADLSEADLSGARYDDNTIWPDGFDPQATGAIKVD